MYRSISLALGLSLAALAGADAAAQSCQTEFEAQKRQLTGDVAAAGRDLRRLRARLDAQEMRLALIADADLKASVPPAPPLPALPDIALGDQDGCTAPVTAAAAEAPVGEPHPHAALRHAPAQTIAQAQRPGFRVEFEAPPDSVCGEYPPRARFLATVSVLRVRHAFRCGQAAFVVAERERQAISARRRA